MFLEEVQLSCGELGWQIRLRIAHTPHTLRATYLPTQLTQTSLGAPIFSLTNLTNEIKLAIQFIGIIIHSCFALHFSFCEHVQAFCEFSIQRSLELL